MNRKRKNGTSIIEIIIALGVIGIIALMGANLFQQGSSIMNTGYYYYDTQVNAKIALDRLISELEETYAPSVQITTYNNCPYISFLSARDNSNKSQYDSTTLDLKWTKYIVYYIDANGNLHRRVDSGFTYFTAITAGADTLRIGTWPGTTSAGNNFLTGLGGITSSTDKVLAHYFVTNNALPDHTSFSINGRVVSIVFVTARTYKNITKKTVFTRQIKIMN